MVIKSETQTMNLLKSIFKSKGALLHLPAAIALSVPLFLTSGATSNTNTIQCTSASLANAQTATTCLSKHNANDSWVAWFSGSSRSTQFHFIDLLELVHGEKDNSRKVRVPTREG